MNTPTPKTKVHITSLLFDFGKGNVTTNLAVEWALGFRDLGLDPELYGHGEFAGTSEYHGEYRGLSCHQFSGLLPLPQFISRRIKCLASAWKYALHVWRHHGEITLIFATSTHAWHLLFQVVAAKLRGIPIVYYFVEEPIALHRPSPASPVRRVLRWWFNLFFDYFLLYGIVMRFASAVACITQELADKLRAWKYRCAKIFVTANVKHASTVAGICPRRDAPVPDSNRFVVFYGGAIDDDKEALLSMLQAGLSLFDKHTCLNFVIAGGGPAAAKLSSFILERGIASRVVYLGQLSWDELKACLAKTDLCVVLKRHHPANYYNFPNKMTDYMSQSKPMLLSDLPLHRRLFEDKASALFAQPDDPASIALAIDWAIENRQLLAEIGRKANLVLRAQLDATRHCEIILKWIGIEPVHQAIPEPVLSPN